MPVDYRKWDHIEVRSDYVMNPPMLQIRSIPELLGKVGSGSRIASDLVFDKLTIDTYKISNLGVKALDYEDEDLTSLFLYQTLLIAVRLPTYCRGGAAIMSLVGRPDRKRICSFGFHMIIYDCLRVKTESGPGALDFG